MEAKAASRDSYVPASKSSLQRRKAVCAHQGTGYGTRARSAQLRHMTS
ncbi:hypothetical protein SMD44_07254 [Streptomyces alboflavus]|uniref:Uncharacterized protein n=1 Tax=Streptomyces alboflavus TaxID=67267 RepID=A0A1Z1WN74_9ACTN|nr:hypothetical protein SMD44_07254 [Streptomyces alboflavus]